MPYNFEFANGPQQGNFYFAKAGQYHTPHRPGTIMRIPPKADRGATFLRGDPDAQTGWEIVFE